MAFYHVYSLTDSPCVPDPKWRTSQAGIYLCESCGTPLQPVPLDVVLLEAPDDIPLNVVIGVGVGIVRKDVFQQLPEAIVGRHLLIGEVFDNGGGRYSDFLSFRGVERLLIRGGPGSAFRECDVCGTQLYHPVGKRYLLRSWGQERPLYQSQLDQLIVVDDLADVVRSLSLKKTRIEELPVKPRARDDLDL